MELRVLNYFLTVAREGGLTGASEVLHVTQPTMSRQIQELEEELGQKLFIRTTRSMVLTPEGWRNGRKRSFPPWAPPWPGMFSSAAVKPSH